MNRTITIGDRTIGPEHPTYIIAEMSANHNHDIDAAVHLIHAARDAGADAIKIQTYTPDTLTIDCDNEYFRIGKGTIWEGQNLYKLYGEAYTPWDWHPKLQEVAREVGLDFFSTPFDDSSVDFLEKLDPPVYKIASFELVDLPLIRRVAATGKPIIMSTGMSSLSEIAEAVQTARQAGCEQLVLLKCTSAYPAPPEEMNLRVIPHLADAFDVPVGLSDHTLGSAVPVAAVTLGACVIEKHFTLSRDNPGPDAEFSTEPQEWRDMVDAIRAAEQAVGSVQYDLTDREKNSLVFRRSLFVVEPVGAGEPFTNQNVRSIRPGYGLHTRHLEQVIGRRATRDIPRGTPLDWELVG